MIKEILTSSAIEQQEACHHDLDSRSTNPKEMLFPVSFASERGGPEIWINLLDEQTPHSFISTDSLLHCSSFLLEKPFAMTIVFVLYKISIRKK